MSTNKIYPSAILQPIADARENLKKKENDINNLKICNDNLEGVDNNRKEKSVNQGRVTKTMKYYVL